MRLNRWKRLKEGVPPSEEKWDTCSPWSDNWDATMCEVTSTTLKDTASEDATNEHCEIDLLEEKKGSHPKDWKAFVIGSLILLNTEEPPTKKNCPKQLKQVKKLGLTPGLTVYTCGCGDFCADSLCSLLYQYGIRGVLDVRALSKSKKKPWFNSDRLVKDMNKTGLDYKFIGKGRKSHTVVAAHVERCEQPICLLGFRASPLECLRLLLSEKLQNGLGWNVIHLQPAGTSLQWSLIPHAHHAIFQRYSSSLAEIEKVKSRLERAFEFRGHWRARVLAHYSSMIPIHLHKDTFDQWDGKISTVEQTVIELPWGSVLVVLPGFLSASELQSLQRNTLPGAVNYEQPRRHFRIADGSFISFTEQWKEAWLCNDYDYQDPSRLSPPHLYKRQPLRPWAEDLLQRASRAALFPFNALMCRWEPPGKQSDLNDGSRSFARGSPIPEYTVVGMCALNGSHNFRVHGLGCWERLVVNVPMCEGTLVVFGGPLKERWLHSHMRDNEVRGEGVFINFLLHADSAEITTSDQDKKQTGLESASTRAKFTKKQSSTAPSPPSTLLQEASGYVSRARWRRADNTC